MLTSTQLPIRIGDVLVRCEAGVLRAEIDRPASKNAINTAVIDGLEGAVDIATNTRARVLVLSGAGGTFCSGADLLELRAMRTDDRSEALKTFMARLGTVLRAIETAPFTSLAVVEGHAVAGGCEIVLACDMAVAATNALIGDRHLEYGLVPAAGGSVRLARTLPRARANYLVLTGQLITGRQAADWGLVSTAVEPNEIASTVDSLAERLAGRSADAIATAKQMIWTAHQQPRDDALLQELRLFLRHMSSVDVSEGLAAFRDRRAPVFHQPPTT